MTEQLPGVNACLNTVSFILLCAGWVAIRGGRRERHIRCMVGALIVSALFLVSYLTYHYVHGDTKYLRHDWTRPVYFFVLISHIILAMVNVPLVIMTVVRAARQQFDRHRRIARWTLPVWLYVSVTGVVVYLMLHWL